MLSNYLLCVYFSGLITNFRSSLRSHSPDFEKVAMMPYDVLRLESMYLFYEMAGFNALRVNLTGEMSHFDLYPGPDLHRGQRVHGPRP